MPEAKDPFDLLEGQHREYAQVIGEICIAFAYIELSTAQMVCICIGNDDWSKGLKIVDKMLYRKTLDLLKALVSTVDNDLFKNQVIELIPKLEKAGTDRNEYVHAIMAMGLSHDGEFHINRAKYRDGKNTGPKKVTLSSLKEVLLRINDTRNAAERLVIDWMMSFNS